MLEEEERHATTWVTVRSFGNSSEAHLAKNVLDAEDIPTRLDNENSAHTLWHLQPAIGDVRLQVPDEFRDEAEAILEADRNSADQAEDEIGELGDEPASGELPYADLRKCPKCHSDDTEEYPWQRRIAQSVAVLVLGAMLVFWPLLMVLVLGFAAYYLMMKPTMRCTRCGHGWTPQVQS